MLWVQKSDLCICTIPSGTSADLEQQNETATECFEDAVDKVSE